MGSTGSQDEVCICGGPESGVCACESLCMCLVSGVGFNLETHPKAVKTILFQGKFLGVSRMKCYDLEILTRTLPPSGKLSCCISVINMPWAARERAHSAEQATRVVSKGGGVHTQGILYKI